MFDYQAAYKRNGTGIHMKTFWLTVLAFIMMYVAAGLFVLVMLAPLSFTDSGVMVLWVFGVGFLFLLSGLFLFYPFSVGILRYYACTYLSRDFGFKEAFKAFTKDRYGKVIKLGILVLIAYIVVSFVLGLLLQLILMAVNTPLIPLVETWEQGSGLSGGQIGLVIGVILLNFLVVVLSYIPYILIAIYLALIYLAYIDQPMTPTADKFKVAWDVMFRSEERIWRLLFSNVLLFLFPLAVYLIFVIAAVMLGAYVNEFIFPVLMMAGTLLMVAAYAVAMYFMAGSITAYYFEGRETLDRNYRQTHQA